MADVKGKSNTGGSKERDQDKAYRLVAQMSRSRSACCDNCSIVPAHLEAFHVVASNIVLLLVHVEIGGRQVGFALS